MHPEGYFAVSYPEGWNVEERGAGTIFTPGATQSFPYIAVGAASFTTEPQFGEPPKVQVRRHFEELGFIPGSRMLDEGPWELDGERAYYGIFTRVCGRVPDRAPPHRCARGRLELFGHAAGPRPQNFQEFLPIAREMADSLEIQG
jgi:hypothetical protein